MNENKPTLEMLFQYWNMATSEQCYDAISLLSGKARLAKEKAEEKTWVPQRLVSMSKACEILGKSSRTIRRMIAAGKLPYIQLFGPGGELSFYENDLRAFLDKHYYKVKQNCIEPHEVKAC